MSDRWIIEAAGLTKRYGATQAVAGVDLRVAEGGVLGVLGPNGAGKSTTVRILSTMTPPDGGWARIGGLDVVTQAAAVRHIIGVTGQDASLDELLTGRQNLTMVAELSKLPRSHARSRTDELLEQFALTDAGDRLVKTYSGGMRRRLDLAASLVARPPILFLDEPTTGLDPTSRQAMWNVIRSLVDEGTTVLLTTQYLDEADALADAIAVIDHGRVIAHGTAGELKARVGGAYLELSLATAHPDAPDALAAFTTGPVHATDSGRRLRAPVIAADGVATAVIRALDGVGATVDDIAVHHPSLDDVFFTLTGRPTAPVETSPTPQPVEVWT